MPRNKFADKKQYHRYLWLVFGTAVACFVVYMVMPLFAGKYLNDTRGGDGIDSTKQILYILTQPLSYTKTLLTFLKDYYDPRWVRDIAASYAYLGTADASAMVFGVLVTAAAIDRSKADLSYNNAVTKIGGAFFAFATTCIVATVLYISFTPVASETINGCQPRYLLPLIYPFLQIVGNFTHNEARKNDQALWLIMVWSAVICYQSTWTQIVEYFCP